LELEILFNEVYAVRTLDIVSKILDDTDGLHLSKAIVSGEEFEWIVVIFYFVSFYNLVERCSCADSLSFCFNEVLDICEAKCVASLFKFNSVGIIDKTFYFLVKSACCSERFSGIAVKLLCKLGILTGSRVGFRGCFWWI